MKAKILYFLIFCCVLLSCNEDKGQMVKVKDQYALHLPAYLTKATDLNDDASLEYQNTFKEFYIIVIDEAKTEYENAIKGNGLEDKYTNDLKGYSELIIGGIDPAVTFDSLPDFKDGIINGMKSRTLEVEGVSEGYHVFWKFAFIEGRNHYYQIMTWTQADKRRKHEKDMDAIINSFMETNRSKK